MQKFEILRRERLFTNPYISVEKQLVRLPNGETADWYLSLGNDVVIVVPVQRDGQILVLETYKHGSGNIIFEFCAGMIEDGESPLEAAKRELLEETGYTASEWLKLGKVYPEPTGSKKRYHFFLAQNAKKTEEPHLDPAEQIRTFLVKDFAELEEKLIAEFTKTNIASIAALTLVRSHFSPHKPMNSCT